MSKEIQIETGVKIRDHYKCEVVIDEIREPHVLFNLHDIGKLLQISNIRSNTRSEDKIHLHLFSFETPILQGKKQEN